MKFAPAKLPFVPREFESHVMLSLLTIPGRGVVDVREAGALARRPAVDAVERGALGGVVCADAQVAADEAAAWRSSCRARPEAAAICAASIFASFASLAAAASRAFASCVAFRQASTLRTASPSVFAVVFASVLAWAPPATEGHCSKQEPLQPPAIQSQWISPS